MQYLTPKEAGNLLRLSTSTLAKMRVIGNGPAYRKHGRRVVYLIDELDRWSENGSRQDTSQINLAGLHKVHGASKTSSLRGHAI